MKTEDVRKQFIKYFEEKGHTYVHAAPVVPVGDPTLLFTNAGMNQFKDVFLEKGTRPFKRAVNSQPCIRVSGKHNDLEEVGHDTYHHTLFEMLGNWSFGDYYKKDAIMWAWELLTEVYKIPREKLYATVYHTDEEAESLWTKHTDIGKDRVLRFGDKDNFWEMGETGPCGPCSEIHIDRGEDYCDKKNDKDHVCGVNAGCARYIELWNLVFIQYNRDSSGKLTELPSKHVDTGAGLERLTAVLSGVMSNYDIDVFRTIISHIEQLSAVMYTQEYGIPHRVIADHIRTLTFAISDGVIPSNEGRGYVIRRILRRASRYGKKINFKEPFLHKLVPVVVEVMGNAFPAIKNRAEYISKVIKSEEQSFSATLDKGIEIFNQLTEKLKKENKSTISGEDVFKLYDTYGFPPDLTELMAKEINIKVDIVAFEKEMEKQKERARAATCFVSEDSDAFKPIGGEAIIARTEEEKLSMARHHTGTHLLQAALRDVLGAHVAQAGSMVSPERLRFDFNHFEALTENELACVETLVNEKIIQNIRIEKFEESYAKALELGALAFFGEKYSDIVKVVKIDDFSIELCGGTHLDYTGQIGLFKIVSESAVAAGVRRIEAVAGAPAVQYVQNKLSIIKELTNVLKSPDNKLSAKISEILEQAKQKEKLIDKLNMELINQSIPSLIEHAELYGNTRAVVKKFTDTDNKSLLAISDELMNRMSSGIVFLASVIDDKVLFIAKASKDLVEKKLSCDELVRAAALICGGSGGGSPLRAQAGGKLLQNVDQALTKVETIIRERLS
ncbi:MAG: alanine--tRNA ligase [Candidatus Margulisiibacteriota bacterium]|nr:MAG: hypothetical protein A2X43_10210 [Candidatus Margulisbacteria bacterium GWD2_39_127]OGI05446.1 MAG: hypothetical protein A2X42_09300 [Candidatus Margulisbacteria bacterium GWF2_38_17]OGI07816.1 MAG: hypothetical protein A2X41_11855 [Candidatus Margulisbacteria bacterium GWE2_39_32]PZM80128.1 MAG: alanine--tRNA ligase [Candidatus Margulisiibacteriota bacterium]HAR62606.1 alanine--tRNA ligase [Candidatus Margulisiibacteriota bacterium]